MSEMGLGSDLCVWLFFAWLAVGASTVMGSSVMNHGPWGINVFQRFNVNDHRTLVERVVARTRTFNVLKHGAVADVSKDSTLAFTRAWKNACAWQGKMTRILIPKGIFLVGPLVFEGPCKSTVIFNVKGAVKAPTDLNKFKDDVWIHFKHINGLLITGGGTFDGQGASAWPHNHCGNNLKCKLLPTSIKLSFVNGAKVSSISSINSKFFHMNIYKSKNIKMKSLKIFAPENSPNTDGIHIGDSSNVDISHSRIGTGDDCISVGPGSYNVTITNIDCGPGHGISVGSLGRYAGEDNVMGLEVKNCVLRGTTNGLRIKTWADSSPSLASDFLFENIVMDNVSNPIIINQQYCPLDYCSQKGASGIRIKNISFKNIWGTSASKVAVKFLCSSKVPCQEVKLSNINIKYNGPGGHALSSCSYVNGLSSGLQVPSSCL